MKLTFGATLPTGVTKDDTDETTVSITDDDAPAGAVTLVLSHTTIAESGTGNSSTVTATLASRPPRCRPPSQCRWTRRAAPC